MSTDARTLHSSLLAWQWENYPLGHASRANLVIHAITAPLFVVANSCALAAPWLGWRVAVGGCAVMLAAIVSQGRGHAREATRPVPFRGAGDAVRRLFLEQWVTFPRFVASGRFAHAWRAAAA